MFIPVSCDKTYTELSTVQPGELQVTVITEGSDLQDFKTLQAFTVDPENEQENMDVSYVTVTGNNRCFYSVIFSLIVHMDFLKEK